MLCQRGGISRLTALSIQSAAKIPLRAKPAIHPSSHSSAENDPSWYARCGARAFPRFHAAETRKAPQQNDADRSAGSLLLCGSAQSVLAVRLPASSLGRRAAVGLPQALPPLLAAFRPFAFSCGAALLSS